MVAIGVSNDDRGIKRLSMPNNAKEIVAFSTESHSYDIQMTTRASGLSIVQAGLHNYSCSKFGEIFWELNGMVFRAIQGQTHGDKFSSGEIAEKNSCQKARKITGLELVIPRSIASFQSQNL